jgi:hypothetical protein
VTYENLLQAVQVLFGGMEIDGQGHTLARIEKILILPSLYEKAESVLSDKAGSADAVVAQDGQFNFHFRNSDFPRATG